MTDPVKPDPQSPQWAAPPPPAPAAGAAGTQSPQWAAPLPPAAVPGAAGFVYADLPNRVIAYIIDIVILMVVSVVIGIVLGGIGLAVMSTTAQFSILGFLIAGVLGLAVSAAYFLYTWTAMRGTIGMKALGMQIGNEGSGATLTMDQAVRRWLAVGGWISIVQFVNFIPVIGFLLSLVGLVYIIYLLYTTAQSPTKQGFHDHYAHTMVVKASRAVA